MFTLPSFALRASVAAACALTPLYALAQDEKPAAERPLLFASNRDGKKMKFNIFSMNADGSGQKNLTKSEMPEFDPALSPDGKQIAFISIKTGQMPTGSLYVMNTDGSGRKPVAEIAGMASAPVWSPDGKRIAFTSFALDMNAPPRFSLQVMDADGKNKKEIGEGMVSSWSPDGKKLLAVRMEGGGFEPRLFMLDADGSNPKKMSDSRAMFGMFSPDGKRIAFISGGEDQPDLYVMNTDGSDKKQMTKTGEMEFAPQWSADGKYLYFIRFPQNNIGNPLETNIEIFRIDADGKNEKALTKESGVNVLPGGAMFLAFATQRQGGEVQEETGKEKP